MHNPMTQARSRLTNKLETLENQVAGTVHSTKDAMGETVDAVKESVRAVSEALDLPAQVQRHPWLVLGGSVALGVLAAQVFKGSAGSTILGKAAAALRAQMNTDTSASAISGGAEGTSATWLDGQLGQLKTLAVTALTNYVREIASSGLSAGEQPRASGNTGAATPPSSSVAKTRTEDREGLV